MSEPTFNLFGPITKDDIKVGYISTDRGYVQGVGVCQANSHAKRNPGETFIYKPSRDKVEFLNINQVNKLSEDPNFANKDTSCPDGLKMDAEPEPVSVRFSGGGGVGVVGNPVVSEKGQLMAVHLVNGGFGYQYPPIVNIHDDSGIGAGAIVKVGVGTTFSEVQYYTDKEDFEEYNLCTDVFTNTSRSDGGVDSKIAGKRSPYGRRWSPEGKDIGEWKPHNYTGDTESPFEEVIAEYMKKLNQSGKDWFTTRKQPPLETTSDGKTTKEFHKVQHFAWGPGTVTPYSIVPFEIHWHSPHRTKGLGFEFIARDGSHKFRIVDTSGVNDGSRKDSYQVKENLTYDVKVIGTRSAKQGSRKGDDPLGGHDNSEVIHLAEVGLLRKLGAGKDQKSNRELDANTTGTGDKIFADFLDTLDDNDDLQIQAQRGKFTAYNERKVQGLRGKRTTYDLTYRLETGRTEIAPSFMNKYAISPKPPSNIKGSDFAGRWFTFEWDLDFPYDGEYIFRGGRDNKARLYLDNEQISDLYSGPGSHFRNFNPAALKKTIKKGNKKLKLELYNSPMMGTVIDQQSSAPSSKEVNFKITSDAAFANSIRIEELGIFESKKHKGSQINANITKTIEFGRRYKVVLESAQSTAGVRLRVKDKSILEMEEHTDNDWKDIVCAASTGQFSDIKGNVAYFSVSPPPRKPGESKESNQKTTQVFNTIDFINKSNRQLWRTNVYNRGGFLNDYGVCPFDTNIQLKDNPYAGTHTIVWPNVNFPISGNYDIEVAVDDTVDIKIGNDIKINKKGFVGDTSVSTGTLKLTRYVKAGRHTISADLYQKPGGSYGFRKIDGKTLQKTEVNFNITSAAGFANKITIPGLFSLGKELGGAQLNQSIIKQVESEKEYDVILTTVRSIEGGETGSDVRLKLKDKGKKLVMEEWTDNDWKDIVCTVNNGEFYGIHGNRCKFRVDRTIKGINPMALAINIESTYAEKKAITPQSWNENPMGVALTIEAPPPPIPQEPVPQSEGRCPNNPFWTTRFPGAKERWYPVTYKSWGDLLNKHGISPLPPYDEHRNPVVDVSFDVHWHSPHRNKGLGYRFTAQDGSHIFTITDTGKEDDGSRTETHKVKLNTTYNVKTIGKRSNPQGFKIHKSGIPPGSKKPLADANNSKVNELAEQGLLTKLGTGKDAREWATGKLDANRRGTGDKIFADFLDTLDDADDLQIHAGAGQFTAFNPRTVDSLRGTRTTYDLTYRVSEVPPNDAGNFTNSWTKSFEFGGWYKAQLEVDDIGELWVDDQKILDLDRRKNKTFDEKLVWIDGPTSDEEYRKNGATNHDIKVVVENFKSERMKTIDAKVFNTLDWIGGGARKAEKKVVRFKITSAAQFANGIKIEELGINESKEYEGSQINVTREKEVEVNKVYNVEFSSSNNASQKDRIIKYVGLNSSNDPIKVRSNNKRIELKDGHGRDVNASFTIDSGNVKFSDDGRKLIIKGGEAKFTLDWNDNPDTAGRAVQSIQIGDKTWRVTRNERGTVTKTVKFPRNSDNTVNIKLRNQGESVVQMEEWTDNDWQDIVCAASEGRFFDFNGNRCKYVVGSATKAAGGITGGTTRDGVTYQGPHLFHYTDSRWGKVINKEGVSPISSPTQSLSDPNKNILGWKVLTWKNVHFPQTGKYQISFVADNGAKLFIDNQEVLASKTYQLNDYSYTDIEVGKGNHEVKVEVFNANHEYRATYDDNDLVFLRNPTGVALRIYTRMTVGTGTYKSWKENPLGVSAKLIPPPCPKPAKGKGVVVDPVVIDPGNRYPTPPGPGYPVRLRMKKPVIIDPGINYNCAEDTIRVEPSNGVKLSLCKCGPFGKVEEVCIEGNGYFTEPPEVIIDSPTGVNLEVALQFEPVVVPPDIPDIIQVTDLVGLKQTGYYKGKPYYGAVFFENGVKYSGWYRTAGEMVRVYDTLQESIDGMVTTPPSAILRQGSDPGGSDPRLNIPGTPENLT